MNAEPTCWPPPAECLLLEVELPGEAEQAGSKKAFALRRKVNGKLRVVINYDRNGDELAAISVTDQNESKLKKRRKLLMGYLDHVLPSSAFTMPPPDAPLVVEAVIHRQRGAGHYGSGRNADKLKDSAPAYPATRPDLTKLWRGEEDHLTEALWPDDSRVVRFLVDERYVDKWAKPFTLIRLWQLPATVGEVAALEGGNLLTTANHPD